MRRIAALTAVVLFLTAAPLLGISQGAPIELKMSHHGSPESKDNEIMKVGADWIEKRFQGSIKCTIFPSQTLLKAANAYDGTVNGIADIALVIPSWTEGRFPKTSAVDLPPAISTAVDGTRAYWPFYKKFLADEWKAVKVLTFHVQMGHSIQTKRAPVKTLEDFKGQKIRVTGIGKDIMQKFGGVPVVMPMPDSYDALRQGVVTGIMVPFTEMRSYRFIDVTFCHTKANIMAVGFFIVMNMNKYNSLPPDAQKALDEELPPYWNDAAAKIWDREEQAGIELVKKTKGHEYITLSPEEQKRWNERAKEINGPWAKAMEAKGLPGNMLLEEKYKAIANYVK